jgi:hypothetical protein
MQQPWLTQHSTVTTKHGVTSLTTSRVYVGKQPHSTGGTRQVASLHPSNTDEDETRMTEIYVTSSVVEMHVTRSKTDVRSMSASNRSSVKKGTMTNMVPITTNLTDNVLSKRGTMQEESRPFPMT